jgi:hypothetical protein
MLKLYIYEDDDGKRLLLETSKSIFTIWRL